MSQQIKVLTVTDLERREVLYNQLQKAVEQHRPDIVALVGDFLFAGKDEDGRLSVDDCARMIGWMKVPEVIFVRGNHEDSAWFSFAETYKNFGKQAHLLEGGCFSYGPLLITGLPCLSNPWSDERVQKTYNNPNKWMSARFQRYGNAVRSLWLSHEPPYGTPLSQREGMYSGHIEIMEAIERFSPLVTVFGHDQQTPTKDKAWEYRLKHRESVCVNVGQSPKGPLHYCILDYDFPQCCPCSPTTISITAYPQNDTFELSKLPQRQATLKKRR